MRLRESGMPDEDVWEQFFEPDAVLCSLHFGAAQGDVVDIGTGYGTFALAAARLTADRVFAIDIDENMLAGVRSESLRSGLANVVTRKADVVESGTGLPAGSAGYVMLFNLLHGERPVELLTEARRLLSPGGLVAVTHWVSDRPTPRGPSPEIRPLPDDCIRWATEAGLRLTTGPVDLPPHHYGLVFEQA